VPKSAPAFHVALGHKVESYNCFVSVGFSPPISTGRLSLLTTAQDSWYRRDNSSVVPVTADYDRHRL